MNVKERPTLLAHAARSQNSGTSRVYTIAIFLSKSELSRP